MINFFDLNEEDFVVLNPYDFDKALERLNNLTLDDVKDDLKHFQKKEFEFRTYEEEVSYTLKNIQILTSSKNDKNEDEYFVLKNLENYLLSIEKLEKCDEPGKKENKIIELKIENHERGRKTILLIIRVDPDKLSDNIVKNFLKKSEFETGEKIQTRYNKIKQTIESDDKKEFRFTIKIDMKYVNKIYHSKDDGKYYFDLQSPPKFRTNFFNSETKKVNEEREDIEPKDENCVFPFRNFEDEFSNLEYRHFIIMIEKETNDTPNEENDINENFDTNKELNSSLENLYKDRNGEVEKEKYIEKKIKFSSRDNRVKPLSYYFNYIKNKENKGTIRKFIFFRKKRK